MDETLNYDPPFILRVRVCSETSGVTQKQYLINFYLKNILSIYNNPTPS